MADLQNDINSEVNNSENINQMMDLDGEQSINQTVDWNLESPIPVEQPQGGSDFTQIFSEDLSENSENINQVESVENISQQSELQIEQPAMPASEESSIATDIPEMPAQEEVQNKVIQAPDFSEEPIQPVWDNNGIVLWKFENEMINTVQDQPLVSEENHGTLEQNVLGNSQIIWESPIINTNVQNQETDKSAQKEKLLTIIKAHESKAQKTWFAKWIASGILLTLWIIAVSFVFAKDQILDLLNNSFGTNNPWLSANVVDMNNNLADEDLNDEVISDDENEINDPGIINDNDDLLDEDLYNKDEENEDDDFDDNHEASQIDEEDDDEYEELDNEVKDLDDEDNKINEEDDKDDNKELADDNEKLTDEDKGLDTEVKKIDDENIKINNDKLLDKEVEDKVNNEDNVDSKATVNSPIENDLEDLDDDFMDEDDEPYTIIHVNSEKDANWVLPAHCNDLTCYGEDKEFTPCAKFRKDETLDENAHRIWNNWTCRYRDISELVYVQLK